MSDTLQHIQLQEIDADALTRDRRALDEAELQELTLSICRNGLRQPVEVFRLQPNAASGKTYGLLSGYRRLQVYRGRHAALGDARFARIPAFLREPAGAAEAFAAMVEENEVRAGLTAWERGRIAVITRDQGVFGSTDAAVDALYPNAGPRKRARLRSIARVADALGDLLVDPTGYGEGQLVRLGAALDRGGRGAMRAGLEAAASADAAEQWSLLAALAPSRAAGAPPRATAAHPRPAPPGLRVQRESTQGGYVVRITGQEAKSAKVERVLAQFMFLLNTM